MLGILRMEQIPSFRLVRYTSRWQGVSQLPRTPFLREVTIPNEHQLVHPQWSTASRLLYLWLGNFGRIAENFNVPITISFVYRS